MHIAWNNMVSNVPFLVCGLTVLLHTAYQELRAVRAESTVKTETALVVPSPSGHPSGESREFA